MASCTNFIEEDTLLQNTLKRCGVLVIRTPKCHAELAGEGIEYTWGFSKNIYRRILYAMKRTKQGFLECVQRVLSRDIITTMHVRKFARKARRYTCAYCIIDNNVHQRTETFVDNNGMTVIDLTGGTTLPSIECLVKQFKIHQCT